MENEAAKRYLPVLNATCSLVIKVHHRGNRHTSKRQTGVQNATELAALTLPEDTPVAYIAQTILSADDTWSIVAALKARFTDIQGPDIRDICYATQNRQSAVRDLGKLVDVILVVGTTKSSSSSRLHEIGADVGVTGHLIADGSELDRDWLQGANRGHHGRRLGAGSARRRCDRRPQTDWPRGRIWMVRARGKHRVSPAPEFASA